MQAREPRFEIGTEYKHYSKRHNNQMQIIDILKTFNSKGELVRINYVVEHEFMGQKVTRNDVTDTEIARSLFKGINQ
jgi:RNase P protein component